MFTVILHARPDPMALTATMGPLVRGVVMGLVGSAFLISNRANETLDEIADAAGARLLLAANWPEGFGRAVASSNGGGLIVLDTGVMLGQDFWSILADMSAFLGDRPAITHNQPQPGFLALLAQVPGYFRAARGIPHQDQAIVMPGRVAREIARLKADPFAFSYGTSLVRLPSQTMRIGRPTL
jgi:hypothetical protein